MSKSDESTFEVSPGPPPSQQTRRNPGGFASLHPGLRVGVIVGLSLVGLLAANLVYSVAKAVLGREAAKDVAMATEFIENGHFIGDYIMAEGKVLWAKGGYRLTGRPESRVVIAEVKWHFGVKEVLVTISPSGQMRLHTEPLPPYE